ncbi:MAG: ATP-binding protein [Streptomycetaceae bacterium]|nr:ATP-binding protein [Streptomycetaceae bacterium]
MNVPTSPRLSDIEWLFPRHPRSVSRARARLREYARAWHIPDESAETAVLLLSELTTNACKHARVSPGREISTRFILRNDTLRIEVSDATDELPRPCHASPNDESGRGLTLVEALVDAWDVFPRPCGIGKTVWFELKLPSESHHGR